MPTYDYLCSKCGHRFEQFQSMNDAPLKKCPKCGKPALKRLIGAGAGLIFKGSGFYVTDYKKSSAPKEGDGSAKAGGESKPSESKPSAGDGKPAAKPVSSVPKDKK